jgi:hypothetical protein
MLNLKKLFLSGTICILITGCKTSPRNEIPFFETSLVENQALLKPVRAISNFDDSLSCMDKLLLIKGVPTTYITSKIIPDASGKVFVSVKDLIITSLSKMSLSSNTFKFVDFETDPLKQDTVQNLTTLLINSGDMHIPKPQIYVTGAISSMDQNILTKGSGLGVASDDFELGQTSDLIATNFSLELQIGDFDTRTILPGIASANQLVIAGGGNALDGGGRIKKAGIQFNLNNNLNQGVGPATRALVDLGMIELVGKWAEIPYWQCLSLDQTHPEFQREMYEWYSKMSESERLKFFSHAMFAGGYLTRDDLSLTSELRNALLTFQKDSGLVPSGLPDFETYDKIMRHYVVVDADGRFRKIGWDKEKDNDSFSVKSDIWPSIASGKRNPLMISVTTQQSKATYSAGEDISFNVQVNRESWVYCYYSNHQGILTKIYPSTFQNEGKIDASKILSIPPKNKESQFSITMSGKGNEFITCAASEQKLDEGKIPSLFKTDFTAINDPYLKANLDSTLKRLSHSDVVISSTSWRVD